MEKQFKIGDKIITTGNSNFCKVPIGTIGKIEKIMSRNPNMKPVVKIEGYNHYENDGNWIHRDYKHYIEELPTFKIIKQRAKKITMVQNNEGNIFGIGDKINFLPEFKSDYNKDRVMIITGFRYRKDETNLCAITDTHPEWGVGIEKIQHSLEFEKEFVLPENWYIIVTRENQIILSNWRFTSNEILPINYIVGMSKYKSGRITKGHNPITYTKGYSFDGSLSYDFGTEITFEQFKKYVLKEEEPIKEETLLEKAKRLYTKGTKIKRLVGPLKNSEVELGAYLNTDNITYESTYSGVYAIFAGNYVIYTHEEGWAKILNPKLKVGDTFLGSWSKNVYIITKIETTNDQEIAFFKDNNGYTSIHHRILTKNIKEWTSV